MFSAGFPLHCLSEKNKIKLSLWWEKKKKTQSCRVFLQTEFLLLKKKLFSLPLFPGEEATPHKQGGLLQFLTPLPRSGH
jgi:hypothetical protein